MQFYKNFTGLKPQNQSQLRLLQNKFGIYAAKMTYAEYFQDPNIKSKNNDYLINHTSIIYIINNQGKIRHAFSPTKSKDEIKNIF